jgi:glycine betaine/proline transport system substrate-binding protein
VPRYIVEGPGAVAPGLRSVADLPDYVALFADPEEPGKGRFYNCPAGWVCEVINSKNNLTK